MTKEVKAKAIVNLITGHAPWNNWNGIARSVIEQSIANGLAEYAKQQAIAFDNWKIENGWTNYAYGFLSKDSDPSNGKSSDVLYNQFIEQQNKANVE